MANRTAPGVMDLPLMSRQEWEEVIVEWNQTAAEYPRQQCVHELFERQAALTPDAVALVDDRQLLSYGQLDRSANRLANRLQMLGVGPERKVALCLEPGLELVVSILAVLKAGGAYVPLDPDYPADRLAFMAADSGCLVAVTASAAADKLRGAEATLVDLRADSAAVAGCTDDRPRSGVGPDNSAYVIYTSGSTGRPKGVEVGHRQLVNYTSAMLALLRPEPASSFALVSTVAADLGNTMLYPSLIGGGSLHIIGHQRARDAEAMADYFCSRAIDYLKIVPSHLRALGAGGRVVMPERALVIGGEAARARWVRGWMAQKPGCRVINHYGPTEATVGALTGELNEEESWETAAGEVVLGRPISNAQAYILDARQRPVPVGVAGELYLGGDGVARGYVARGPETAERFVPDPFGEGTGRRMYRTGDRARRWEDGRVEFLGRVDDQVKVRGYRIELGEIEALLNEHASVEQAVVVAREDGRGEKRLVGYVVGREEVSSKELREYLQERLPDYMVPSQFVELDRIPLTANGKIDRRALPEPERADAAGRYVAPRTRQEEILCRIWGELLGLERVGVEDNFFELGGDSILSIQVIARARQAGLGLMPRHLFERQTIAGLAELAGEVSAVESEQGELEGELPLTPIQVEFFWRGLAKPEHYNQSVLLEVDERAESPLLERAVRGLVTHHDALRLRFEQERGQWRQSYSSGEGEGVYERVDLRRLGEGERVEAMERDAARRQGSLRLGEGLLMRAVEYELGERGRRLLIVVHHLGVDGVSWRILLEDLQRGYGQLERGEAIELGAKTSSYRQWAERLKQYGQSEGLRQEVDYWVKQQATEAVQKEELEQAQERSYARAGREVRWLSEGRTRQLLSEVPSAYHTQIQDALLTGLCEAFRRASGERGLVVELEGHGREEVFDELDVSRTVGWFTSTYPVKLESEEGPIGEALKQVKEQLRGVPKRGIGYGVLRYLSEDEQVRGRLSQAAEPKVRFNYLGQFDQMLSGEGLLRAARESSGPNQARENHMPRSLDVSSMVAGGRMRIEWGYSSGEHRGEQIAELADHYMRALEEIIEHCMAEGAGGYTPSDFPEVHLTVDELDNIIAKLNQATE